MKKILEKHRSDMQVDQPTLHNDENTITEEFKEYTYSVSHDLSAPVRAMVEFSKILADENADTLNEEGKQYLSLIVENGVKLQAMMDGLLQYSRLNTMAKPFTRVDANRIIEDLRVILEKQILTTHTKIDVVGVLPTVVADIEQLMQVFQVLIDNAIKFQPAGNAPQVTISAREEGGFWQFAIKDNGIGIAPEYQEKIFKLFGRLHTDDEYSGVGIGLTLAQKIVQRHGGKIWYKPASETGSTFYFTLPHEG